MVITVIVPGEPTAKGRPRFRQWKAKDGRAGVTAYMPGKTANAEAFVKERAAQAMDHWAVGSVPKAPLTGPLTMVLTAHLPIRASWSKRKQADARAGLLAPTSKPDLTNISKTYEDALNGIVWIDDSQIVECILRKRYSDQPRVELTVEPWTAQATATAARSAA